MVYHLVSALMEDGGKLFLKKVGHRTKYRMPFWYIWRLC